MLPLGLCTAKAPEGAVGLGLMVPRRQAKRCSRPCGCGCGWMCVCVCVCVCVCYVCVCQ